MSSISRLTRMRWGVRAVLALGVAASVTANVLHARPNPISQTIAGWPPIALLLTVELISRIPVHRRGLAAVRIIATALIAGIAAWVSYWHMAGVAARYGETGASAYLLPLSVDGLIVVASVCLVELGGHLATVPAAGRATRAVPDSGPVAADVTPDATGALRDEATEPAPPVRLPAAPLDAPASTAAMPAEPVAVVASVAPEGQPAFDVPAGESPVLSDGTASPAPPSPAEPAPVYVPASDEDAAMYRAWLRGAGKGQEPSGADLARAAGRADDTTGIGRRAARRYRDAHAKHRTDPHPASTDGARGFGHYGHQHNGHNLTGVGS